MLGAASPPPTFTSTLQNQTFIVPRLYTWNFPSVTPSSASVTILATSATPTIPSFVHYSSGTVTISATTLAQVNTYYLHVKVNRGQSNTVYNWEIDVIQNTPPVITCPLESRLALNINALGFPINYSIPYLWDANYDISFVGATDVTGLPSYGSVSLSPNQLEFSVTSDPVGKIYNLTIYANDGWDRKGPYSMQVIVTDKDPPSFNTSSNSFSNQNYHVGGTQVYSLPALLNFNALVDTIMFYTSTADPTLPLDVPPSYIAFDQATLTLTFSLPYSMGYNDNNVALVITDGVTTATNTYCLYYQIYNTQPYWSTGFTLQDQYINSGQLVNYTIGAYDPENAILVYTSTSALPNFVVLSNDTFIFTPNSSVPTQVVYIEFTISDGYYGNTWSFNLYITLDSVPYYSASLVDQVVSVGTTVMYTLPSFMSSNGYLVTQTLVNPSPSPSYITYTSTNITFAPNLAVPAQQLMMITFELSDGFLFANYSFYLNITNDPPTSAATSQVVSVGQTLTYSLLTLVTDPEGGPITITVTSIGLPTYISFTYPSFTINPDYTITAVPTLAIDFIASDGVNVVSFTFNLTVINLPPSIITSLVIPNINVNTIYTYNLSSYVTDPEGNSLSFSCTMPSTFSVMSLLGIITFSPPYLTVQQLNLGIPCTANDGVQIFSFSFFVNIINAQPSISPSLATQTVVVGNTLSYPLVSSLLDPEGGSVTLTISGSLPAYTSISGNQISFAPPTSISNSTITVNFILTDGVNPVAYSFIVNYLNCPLLLVSALTSQTVTVGQAPLYYDMSNLFQSASSPSLQLTLGPSTPGYISNVGLVIAIQPSYSVAAGTFALSFYVSDTLDTLSESIQVTIINKAPTFVTVLVEQSVTFDTISTYSLPSFVDTEGNNVSLSILNTLPSYASFNESNNAFTFSPVSFPCASGNIVIILNDGAMSNTYQLQVNVAGCPLNTAPVLVNFGPPVFTQQLVSQSMMLGDTLEYVLPPKFDPNGLVITQSVTTDPIIQTAMHVSDTSLTFTPTDPLTQVGQFLISLALKDNKMSSSSKYKFTLTIISNRQPITKVNITNSTQRDPNYFLTNQTLFTSLNISNIVSVVFRKAQISANGILSMTVNSTEAFLTISQLLNNQSLQIQLVQQHQAQAALIQFSSVLGQQSSNVLKFQLQFTDSSTLSLSQTLDSVLIVANQTLNFVQGTTGYQMIQGTSIKAEIPPQLASSFISQILGSGSTSATKYAFLGVNIAMNLLVSGLISLLWGALNNLSSLTILFLIGIPISGGAQTMSSTILSFSQLQIIPSGIIDNSIWSFNDKDDEPLNTYFNLVGYGSKNAIENMGSTYNYLMVNAAVLAFIGLMRLINATRFYNWLQSKFLWNYFLRFIIQQYVTIFISSLINFYWVNFSRNGETTAIVSSIALLLVCTAVPIFMTVTVIKWFKGQVSDEQFKKFTSLTEGLKTNTLTNSLWNIIGLAKWIVTCTILVTWREYPGIQIITLMNMSVLYQSYLISNQPYLQKADNYLNIFNEFLISTTLMLFLTSSDFSDSIQLKIDSGYAIMGVLALSCIANLGFFAIRVIHQVFKTVQKRWQVFLKSKSTIAVKPLFQTTIDLRTMSPNRITIMDHSVTIIPLQNNSSLEILPAPQASQALSISKSKGELRRSQDRTLSSLPFSAYQGSRKVHEHDHNKKERAERKLLKIQEPATLV